MGEWTMDDARARIALRDALENGQYTWRTIGALRYLIGSDEEKTRDLLQQIGARRYDNGDRELWRLS